MSFLTVVDGELNVPFLIHRDVGESVTPFLGSLH